MTDENEQSEQADWTSIVDQARRASEDLAAMMGKYHRELLANGLTREEATAVAVDFQRLLLGH